MVVHGWLDPDRAAAVELLKGRADAIVSGRTLGDLSPLERAGVIIVTKTQMALLDPHDMETLLRGAHLVDQIGLATWGPNQRPRKSSVDVLDMLQ
jgi:hypothetical protein